MTSYGNMCRKITSVEFHRKPDPEEITVRILVEGKNPADVEEMMNCLCVSDWVRDFRHYKILHIDKQPCSIRSTFVLTGEK